jgi:outer membrane protein OmpA-like peptidoglycan-associated protein
MIRIAVVLPVLLLLVSGCATRGWVREVFQKKEAEIDQRFVRVEGQMNEQAQRVEGMGFRVNTLETAVGEVRTVALGARDRADGAFAQAEEVNTRLTRLWNNRHNRAVVDTLNIHFGFDRWDLDDRAQTALQGLVSELKQNPNLSVELVGFADPKGNPEYNVVLSHRRAEAVRRYLVSKGVELPRVHLVGMGVLADQNLPDAGKRRVTVSLTAPTE